MAHAFQTIPAKPAFGSIKEIYQQGEYISRKKGKLAYCGNRSICRRLGNASSYDQKNLHNLGRRIIRPDCRLFPFNKSNLIAGQFTGLDLINVCVAINQPIPNEVGQCAETFSEKECIGCDNPVKMQVDMTPGANYGKWNGGLYNFYQDVYIDPIGELFGNSQCGELNYTHYMVYKP